MHDTALDWLRLALACGFSTALDPARPQPLLAADVRPRHWLGADPASLTAQGLTPRQAVALCSPGTAAAAAGILRRTQSLGLGLLVRDDPRWPEALARAPNAPLALWYQGDLAALERPSLAVVGTRQPTPYGVHACRAFVEALALAGWCVGSGLARGIDAEAHRAALSAGAPTAAVLGSGLDAIYPREHASLAAEIASQGGVLLSEYPPGHAANRGTFPRRNRILAALAAGVLVIEAGRRSGTLITCDWALAGGKTVWAVPGPWAAPQSEGCHRLIRDGAQLADSPESLLRDLGVAPGAVAPGATQESALEAELLRILRRGPRLVDALTSEASQTRAAVLVALQRLVAAGRVESLPGGSYVARARREAP